MNIQNSTGADGVCILSVAGLGSGSQMHSMVCILHSSKLFSFFFRLFLVIMVSCYLETNREVMSWCFQVSVVST